MTLTFSFTMHLSWSWSQGTTAFYSFFYSNESTSAIETSAFTQIDRTETPEAHVYKVDVPGLKMEEMKMEAKGRTIQISGERSKGPEEKNDKSHHAERSNCIFQHCIILPKNAKADQLKASVENGVLTVTVPKEEAKKPEVKTTEISN